MIAQNLDAKDRVIRSGEERIVVERTQVQVTDLAVALRSSVRVRGQSDAQGAGPAQACVRVLTVRGEVLQNRLDAADVCRASISSGN